ncbi:MAG: FmdB family zinc ribbon protein [Acidobacteriota bacterium]
MPLYEYQCSKCGSVFEKLQRYSDPPLTEHEGCGGKVEKQLSAPAFQFKGSGWYVTDYAKSGSSQTGTAAHDKAEKAEKGEKSDSSVKTESKSESSSESKPAESKTAESKPAESKPAAATKTESKPAATPTKSD